MKLFTKKPLISIFFLFCATTTFLFASQSITVQAAPYSYQIVKYNLPIQYNSEYGWGVKTAYRYNFADFSSFGADLSFTDYKYTNLSQSYLVLSFLLKVDYIVRLTEKACLNFDAGGGADLRILNSVTKLSPAVGFYFGFEYSINEKLGIATGFDLKHAWQTNTDPDYNSRNYTMMTNLGVKIKL